MANEFIIRKGFKSQEDSQITGSISLSGSFKDQESSSGTAGQVLSSTVSGSQWVDAADSSAITGTGTTGTITKWTTGGSVIGDSIITESTLAEIFSTFTMGIDSFNSVTLGGQIDISFDSDPSITSNQLAGNTFTFTGANIGTIPAGSYTIGSNDASTSGLGGDKVRITLNPVTQTDTNSGTGNSQVVTLFTTGDPTLEVDGATTFTGAILIQQPGSTGLVTERTGGTGSFINLKDNASNVFIGGVNSEFVVQTPGSSYSNKLTISSAGDATFSGNISLADTKYIQLNNTSTDWRLRADNAGRFVIQTSGGSEFFKISSGGVVGIGVTPSAQSGGALAGSVETDGILRVRGANGSYFTSGNGLELSKSSIYSYDRGNGNYNTLSINDTITVEGAGNVGIGTTPSNWKSTWKALNIGQSVGLFSQDNNTTGLSSNVIFDGSNWTNKNIGATAFYQQSEGAHYFYGNGSSTDAAGTTFSPTTRLTISSGGDVAIGSSASKGFLNSNGTAFELDVNRNPNTGAFGDVNKSHARIEMNGASGGSSILFKTASANNTTATTKLTISSGGDVRIDNNVGIGTGAYSTQRLTVINSSVFANAGTDGGNSYVGTQPILSVSTDGNGVASGNYASNNIFVVGIGGAFGSPTGSTTTKYLRIQLNGKLYYSFTSAGGSVNDVTYNPSTKEVYYISSSRRYKENIKDYNKSTLDNVLKLKVKTFDYINGNGIDQVGLIAEEVNEHIPELVPKMEIEGFDEPQPNSVRYSQLSVFLLKAIQEQQTIIESQKSLIDGLATRIETLEG